MLVWIECERGVSAILGLSSRDGRDKILTCARAGLRSLIVTVFAVYRTVTFERLMYASSIIAIKFSRVATLNLIESKSNEAWTVVIISQMKPFDVAGEGVAGEWNVD